jgi:hypothetical protein
MEKTSPTVMEAMFGNQAQQEREMLEVRRLHEQKAFENLVTFLIMFVVVGLVLATVVGLWWRCIGSILFPSG